MKGMVKAIIVVAAVAMRSTLLSPTDSDAFTIGFGRRKICGQAGERLAPPCFVCLILGDQSPREPN